MIPTKRLIDVADEHDDNFEKMIDDDQVMIGLAFPFQRIVAAACLSAFQFDVENISEKVLKATQWKNCLYNLFAVVGFLFQSLGNCCL